MNATPESRSTEPHLLHFSLQAAAPDDELTLHVCLRRYPLQRHDAHTRAAARGKLAFLRHVADTELTHYLDVQLPTDAVAMVEVTKKIVVDGYEAEQTLSLSVHVPRAGVEAARRNLRERAEPLWDVHPKLSGCAHLLNAADDTLDPFPDHIDSWRTEDDSAAALLYTHPDLVNLSVKGGGVVPAHILDACIRAALRRTSALTDTIRRLGDRWMKTERAYGPDRTPLVDGDGKPVFSRILHADVQSVLPGVLARAVRLAKDDTALRDEQWTLQYGMTSDTYGARAQVGDEAHVALLAAEADSAGAGPYKWALANRTPGCGLVVDPNLSYAPAPTQPTFNVTDIWMSADEGAKALTPALVQDLLAGRLYVALYTPAHTDGILRAQLVVQGKAEPGKEVFFTAQFQGSASASASGVFRLNDLRTALTFQISATGLGTSPSGAFGVGAAGERGRDVRPFAIVDDSAYGTLTMKVTNEWLRHLACCVQYRDENGKPIVPRNWSDKIPSGLRAIFQQDDNTKFVALIPPVRTVFGVPIPPDPTVISIPVPPEARSIQVYYGGLGYGGSYNSAVCPVGVAVTVVAEMAVPLILLFAGTAVTNSQTVVKLMADKEVLFAVCTVAGFLVAGGTATYIGTAQDSSAAIKDVAITLGPMLLSPVTALGQWLLQKVAEGAAARAVPFFNVFTTVVSGAVTAAQLSQTIIEVASSPWAFHSEVTRAIDLDITLTPDRDYGKFPDQATAYAVRVVYDKGATLPYQVFQLAGAPPRVDPIKVRFSDVPAGGRLKVYAFFYARNGWQAGQGESPWMDAKGTNGSTLEIASVEIKTNLVELGNFSVYEHASKIAYDKAKGGHYWHGTTEAPKSTVATPSPYGAGKAVKGWVSITTAQKPAMVAYAWSATGLHQPLDDPKSAPYDEPMFTLQNLSTLKPEDGYAKPSVGFSAMPGVFYDLAGPDDGNGLNYFVDSSRGTFDAQSNPAGGMHLRQVALRRNQHPVFAVRSNVSWGRFHAPMDRYVLHSQGYVIGVRYSANKIFILELPPAPSEDAHAKLATMAAGEGFRDGLINGPMAIAAGLDGRVLILEGVNNRVQAFDIAGKPVPYFKNTKGEGKVPTMNLASPKTSKYLDLAVEAKGYIYVLSCRGEPVPENYHVDLYEPDGTHLASTPRVAADKITVDILRTLFTLNYEVILGQDGRTEPSVSMWIPPAPKPGAPS